MSKVVRIGMLTPSSNTCLEPVTQDLARTLDDVGVHFTRVRVVNLNRDEEGDSQFTPEPMVAGATLLADAGVDVIAWNGTSGSWLGLDRDREICAAIKAATGVEATTTTLTFFDAFAALGVSRLGLVVPYITELTKQIVDTYASEGIDCVAESHLGIEANLEIGLVPPQRVRDQIREVAVPDVQAAAVVCTNTWGCTEVPQLEGELGIAVLDSVLVTFWGCLRLLGRRAPELSRDWGKLFNHG